MGFAGDGEGTGRRSKWVEMRCAVEREVVIKLAGTGDASEPVDGFVRIDIHQHAAI